MVVGQQQPRRDEEPGAESLRVAGGRPDGDPPRRAGGPKTAFEESDVDQVVAPEQPLEAEQVGRLQSGLSVSRLRPPADT